jgi:hypothetical protein
MRKHTLIALVASVLALGALGVWWGPSLMDRMDRDTDMAAPVADVTPAAETAPPRRARAAVAKNKGDRSTTAPAGVATLPATQPELHERLKPVLNRGTKMHLAAEGFRDAEQFATVAHAARNTGVPFVVLKHHVLEEKQSLVRAIRTSKPGVDAEREAARAKTAARHDIAAIAG